MSLTNKKIISGVEHEFTYYTTNTHKGYDPITQCYGICFTPEGKVLIGKPKTHPHYMLPGGTPEGEETPEETLKREVDEEVSCDVLDYQLLGVQKVEFPNKELTTRYQLRYACLVHQKTLTPDPDIGEEWEILALDPEEVNDYLQWGEILDTIIAQAVKWYEQKKSE